jgi:hypothetical protein
VFSEMRIFLNKIGNGENETEFNRGSDDWIS